MADSHVALTNKGSRDGRSADGMPLRSDVIFPADASLPLVPPSVLAHDLNERRALWGDQWERWSRSRVLDVAGPLINGSPTVVRERLSVGGAQLRARNFMLRWLVCARCGTAFNPEQFRYWNVQPDDDEILAMLGIRGLLYSGPPIIISDSYRKHLRDVLEARDARHRKPSLMVDWDRSASRNPAKPWRVVNYDRTAVDDGGFATHTEAHAFIDAVRQTLQRGLPRKTTTVTWRT
jgi:hypothetical protein